MSNVEVDPQEWHGRSGQESRPGPVVEVLKPRDVPLGGPRAMTVRRTLPDRRRSMVGAWCFADHYGPDEAGGAGAMTVPPHPTPDCRP